MSSRTTPDATTRTTTLRVFRIAPTVSLGGFLFGFAATVISGVVGFVTREFSLEAWQQGLVVGAPTLAAVLASLTVGPLADMVGRKRVLQLLALVYALSAALSAFAPTFWTLVFARGLGGYAFGSLMLAPIYIAEISPAKQRGFMVSVNQLNIVVGFSAAYFANYAILQISESGAAWVAQLGLDSETWRFMLGLELLPAVLFLLLLTRVPESPRWLMTQGREDEARSVLAGWLEAEKLDGAIKDIRDSLEETVDESKAGEPESGVKAFKSKAAALLRPELRFALLIGLIVAVAQQITGVNAVYFYAPSIFEQSGVGTNAAFAQAIWVGLTNVVFTLVAMALIDRLGRKPLMMIGLAGVLVSMSVAALGFHQATYQLEENDLTELVELDEGLSALDGLVGTVYGSDLAFKGALEVAIGKEALRQHEATLIQAAIQANARLILAGILGFVASFAFSLGPVMWVLLSEIFPNHVRGFAMSAVSFFNSLVSFGVQFFFPLQIEHLGSAGTFLIYGGFAAIGLGLVGWLLPETKNLSLEELEELLSRKGQTA